jgi:long-subunit acyl-CoA synthetase (AMP-forming)
MRKDVFRMVSNTVALVLLQAACQSAAFASHPSYMHAMSDLRYAKLLLEHGDARNVMRDENAAANEINACLHDLTKAAWYDGKDLHDHPNPQISGWDTSGRLHKVLELLEKAHKDMAKEEDDPAAVGFKDRALKHVDRAIGFTHRAVGDKIENNSL